MSDSNEDYKAGLRGEQRYGTDVTGDYERGRSERERQLVGGASGSGGGGGGLILLLILLPFALYAFWLLGTIFPVAGAITLLAGLLTLYLFGGSTGMGPMLVAGVVAFIVFLASMNAEVWAAKRTWYRKARHLFRVAGVAFFANQTVGPLLAGARLENWHITPAHTGMSPARAAAVVGVAVATHFLFRWADRRWLREM